jgi:hypothetical protein
MSDTPETDLEDDLSIDCNNPCYNCPVVKESTGAHLTCDFVPAEFARRLERERDELRRLWDAECAESRKLEQAREYNAELLGEARKDAAMWKANHDNQVELKSIISKRGDLKDRAPRVEKLIAERDQLRKRVAELERAFQEALNDWQYGLTDLQADSYGIARDLLTKTKEEQL